MARVNLALALISLASLSVSIDGHWDPPLGARASFPAPFSGDTSPGSVWPQPQQMITSAQLLAVDVSNFAFKLSSGTTLCSILTEAFRRYQQIIHEDAGKLKLQYVPMDTISSLEVEITSGKCEEYPSMDMDEEYYLHIENPAKLQGNSVWGILRGLETFSQLLYKDSTGMVVVNKTSLYDYPRFKYRGVLLDTSRHYVPIQTLKQNLDAMAYNKFNVLHWHIVDYQSFPYVSVKFPDLSAKGAYNAGHNTHIYTPDDVQAVIEHARLRGIRVVVEFDTPGHALSWGYGQPNLLTPCYTDNKTDGTYGPVNPILESNYVFLKEFFTEVKSVFPDSYIHLGGDEVSFNCWKSNPDITAWMKQRNITTYAGLEQYYIQRLLSINEQIGYSYIVWQEVVDNGVKVRSDTVVEVWINGKNLAKEVGAVTKKGLRTIIAAPWYLDGVVIGHDWEKFYAYEPYSFNGTYAQKQLVIGGEACLWGEYADATNLTPRLWPRASAVAERLWSSQFVNNTATAGPRLHQHRCRMMNRGIPAQPIFPSYCEKEWNP